MVLRRAVSSVPRSDRPAAALRPGPSIPRRPRRNRCPQAPRGGTRLLARAPTLERGPRQVRARPLHRRLVRRRGAPASVRPQRRPRRGGSLERGLGNAGRSTLSAVRQRRRPDDRNLARLATLADGQPRSGTEPCAASPVPLPPGPQSRHPWHHRQDGTPRSTPARGSPSLVAGADRPWRPLRDRPLHRRTARPGIRPGPLPAMDVRRPRRAMEPRAHQRRREPVER